LIIQWNLSFYFHFLSDNSALKKWCFKIGISQFHCLDLQNPNTFTLGMDGGKKKITKASFMDNTSSLSDNMDTSDPLGSFPCYWSFLQSSKNVKYHYRNHFTFLHFFSLHVAKKMRQIYFHFPYTMKSVPFIFISCLIIQWNLSYVKFEW
jgi:hypothetical protein